MTSPPAAAAAPTAASRLEADALGEIAVPAASMWGAQTERARRHFAFGDERMPIALVQALALLKGLAAEANAALGRLDAARAHAIAEAAAAVARGEHDAQFPLPPWQSGSGTQTNMNVNEVIAFLASRRLGLAVHPNDHVNLGQSSNDMVPSALHVAVTLALQSRLLPALETMIATLRERAAHHGDVIALGRTHLQDAVPMRLSDAIGAWASALETGREATRRAMPALAQLAIGGTAVGSGLNTHPAFAAAVCDRLAARTGTAFVPAPDRFAALAGHEPLVALHGALRVLAVALRRLADDVRLLASGPRAGIGELVLPANEPGSSIMPGKINPTQCEMLAMVCVQVMGHDLAVAEGAAAGHLQLATMKPLVARNVLASIALLADAMRAFEQHALRGLEADRERIAAHLGRTLMLATALAPHIGYDRAAAIALAAHREGRTLREAALAEGVAAADFDRWCDPRRMLGPA